MQVGVPVFVAAAVITPAAETDMLCRYCVAVVEQPAAETFAGHAAFVDAYSWTEVLHAASAATASDIFDRTT